MGEIQKIEIENFDFTGLILKEPKEKAVGLPAIISSVKQAAKYMYPIDAFKLSLKINQKGGFDCPGCAWPDPDDDRSALGEYCENGMKAIAEEVQKDMEILSADLSEKAIMIRKLLEDNTLLNKRLQAIELAKKMKSTTKY